VTEAAAAPETSAERMESAGCGAQRLKVSTDISIEGFFERIRETK
jgi:hypothetical protein